MIGLAELGKELSELGKKSFSLDEIPETLGDVSGLDEIPEVLGEGDTMSLEKDVSGSPIEGNNGHWDGVRGNSNWYPEPDYIPPEVKGKTKSNPDHKTMEELFEKYGKDVKDGVPFKDGNLDLSEFSKGIVEIDDFSGDRATNFLQADMKQSIAEGGARSPGEIEKWRRANNYTWHECQDRKTMQLVPHEIHANVSHKGGVSIERQVVADKFGYSVGELEQWIDKNKSSWRACKDLDSIEFPQKEENTLNIKV